MQYPEKDYPLSKEVYEIVGICMDVHRTLGRGFLEIVYKDALEYEFKKHGIEFEREKEYPITYKDIVLPHKFYADFVVWDDIILEVKAQEGAIEPHFKQVINYLAASKAVIGLL